MISALLLTALIIVGLFLEWFTAFAWFIYVLIGLSAFAVLEYLMELIKGRRGTKLVATLLMIPGVITFLLYIYPALLLMFAA